MYLKLEDSLPGQGPHRLDIGMRPCKKSWIILAVVMIFSLFLYVPLIHLSSRKPIAFVWPANQTRNTTILLEPSKPTTILWPTDVCTSNNKTSDNTSPRILLLVIVCSAVNNFKERQVIRETWAKDQDELSNIKVIFLLGQLKNSTFQKNVTQESEINGDLLQEGFIDSYANLTIKSLMLLKWFNRECRDVPYVFKTDDDMYINLKQLFQLVISNKKPNLLMGSLICGAVPIRDPYNKWYCPRYMFDRKSYPNYLSGTAYLMSKSSAMSLYEAALTVPIFHLEDIFVTGILAEQVGIRPEDHVGFSYIKRKLSVCLFSQIISSHHMSEKEIRDIYSRINNSREINVCPKFKTKNLRAYGPGKCKWNKKE